MARRTASFNQQGYTLAGVLLLIAILSIFMALSVQLWSWIKQRDNEEELIFRGREYVEAIARYHAKFNSYPPELETLQKQKFIRKLYKDPMTKSGEWKVLHPDSLVQTGVAGTINQPGTQQGNNKLPAQTPGDSNEQDQQDDQAKPDSGVQTDKNSDEEPETKSVGPIVGVVSRSTKKSLKIYNGQDTYNKWVFVFAAPQQRQEQQPPEPQPGAKPHKKGKPPKNSSENPPPEKNQ